MNKKKLFAIILLMMCILISGCRSDESSMGYTGENISGYENTETVYVDGAKLDDISRSLHSSAIRILLSCGYFDNPEEIDLEKLIYAAAAYKKNLPSYSGNSDGVFLTGRYIDELLRLKIEGYDLPYDEIKNGYNYRGYVRVPCDELDDLLESNLGISVKDLKTESDIICLDKYNMYYCRTPAGDLSAVSIDACEITGNTARVYFDDKILTAENTGDKWQIRSLTENPGGYSGSWRNPPGKGMYEYLLWAHIERFITLEEANEINKALYFKYDGDLPEERLIVAALRRNPGDRLTVYEGRESIVESLVKSMAYTAVGEKYFDKEHPYLTVDDTEEKEYLKDMGYDIDFDAIADGSESCARIPYSEVDRLLQTYMGISLHDIEGADYNNKYGVFYEYVRNDTPRTFCCEDGYYTDKYLRLMGTDYLLTLLKTDGGYKFLSMIETDEYALYMEKDDRKEDVYERNGTHLKNYTTKIRDRYFEQDVSKGSGYNNAVQSFDSFLKKAEDRQREIYLSDGYELISGYGLYDMTGDGIPEMLCWISRGPFHSGVEMYMYLDGQVKSMPVPSWANQHGPLKILSNGMIGVYHAGAGYMYTFYSYDSDGTVTETAFGAGGPDDFALNYREVTKGVYEEITAYYLEEFEKEAEIEWYDYFEDIVY